MPTDLSGSATFCLHRLDLHPSLNELFHAFHDSCIRRKIVRAQREGVTYEDGTSDGLLHEFYQLVVLTRRRQQIALQPLSWFRNLIALIGKKGKNSAGFPWRGSGGRYLHDPPQERYDLQVRLLRSLRFHRLGSMQLMIWKAIQEAKESGLLEFDMGRTDWGNEGLLAFKDRWGCTCTFAIRRPSSTAGRKAFPPALPSGFLLVRQLVY